MLLVMLAMLFMMEQKIVYGEPSNLLSCRDIVQVLAKALPHKDRTVEDVISIIGGRHKKRELAITGLLTNCYNFASISES